MVGNITYNIWMGVIAFLVTFITALSGNVLTVSLERAFYAFLLFFVAMFPVRWLIHKIAPPAEEPSQQTGMHIDLVTPEAASNETNAQIEPESESELEPSEQFTPLVPKRIELPFTPDNPANNPTEIADVIRRLTDE